MCILTSGTGDDCNFATAGLQTFLIANYADVTGYDDTNADDVIDKVLFSTVTITDVTNASPAVVTAAGHGLSGGEKIFISGTSPMSGLVGTHFVGSVLSADTFELLEADGTTPYDSTLLAAFTGSSVELNIGAFYEFSIRQESSNWTSTLQEGANQNKFMLEQAIFPLYQLDDAAMTRFEELALGKFVVLTQNNSAEWVLLGRYAPLEARADGVVIQSGQAFADAAGGTITLQGAQKGVPTAFDFATNGVPVFPNA